MKKTARSDEFFFSKKLFLQIFAKSYLFMNNFFYKKTILNQYYL